jgi:hypothetical protein
MLTTHPLLVPMLGKIWAIPPLTLWVLLGLLWGSLYLYPSVSYLFPYYSHNASGRLLVDETYKKDSKRSSYNYIYSWSAGKRQSTCKRVEIVNIPCGSLPAVTGLADTRLPWLLSWSWLENLLLRYRFFSECWGFPHCFLPAFYLTSPVKNERAKPPNLQTNNFLCGYHWALWEEMYVTFYFFFCQWESDKEDH